MASERELRMRRIKRQMKAGASLVLALAAGTFLACQRAPRPTERSPMGPDARTGPSPAPSPDASAPHDASAPSAPDASATDASAPADATTDTSLATRDAALATRDADASRNRHHVDVVEHRRGLPVIDNLLE